jgi:alkylation response protein AidB-like acyl-CoA dehydrogenase
MDFALSEDQREIQRTARELLAERARPERVREHAEARRFDDSLWRELCELGWPGIAVAERYGGQGLGLVELSILCEELGRVVAPAPFLPTALAAILIEHAGSEEQRARYLPGLAGGELVGALGEARDGVAELVVGAEGAQVLVLAEWDAPRVCARVCAREEVLVEPCDSIDPTRPSARVSARAGVSAQAGVGEAQAGVGQGVRVSAGADVAERNVSVSVRAEAGEELAGDVQGGLDRALVAIASELVGVCDRALAMTVAYVKQRKQFGVPVGAYQAVSHRCAQMLLDTEQARSLSAFAAWAADADPSRLGEAAAMASAAASDAGIEVTTSAIQAHGGIGFTWEADVHWLYKRALLDASMLGPAKRQRARLAGILASP